MTPEKKIKKQIKQILQNQNFTDSRISEIENEMYRRRNRFKLPNSDVMLRYSVIFCAIATTIKYLFS